MEYSFQTDAGVGIFINIKPNAISVVLNETTVYTFDREGRLVSAVIDNRTYRRGLDNRMLCGWSGRQGGVQRCWLSGTETRRIMDLIRDQIQEALKNLEHKAPPGNSSTDYSESAWEVRRQLRRILCFDPAAIQKELEQLAKVYRPVTILPPDQYLSLVLQATEGCSFNRCSFCTFYRDRPFRIKPLPEFKRHIDAVLRFLGEGITLRKSVFLADANAVCIPRDELLPMLDAANEALPIRPSHPGGVLNGIYSFVDAFAHKKGERQDFAELSARGVRRLYLGVETGCRALLHFLHKPQTPEDVLETVLAIKEGGINVAVILMLGIGGDQFADRHIVESLELLNSIPWHTGDLVFLSEFVEFPEQEYSENALRAGIRPLAPEQMLTQYLVIRQGIRKYGVVPKIAPYNAGSFIY